MERKLAAIFSTDVKGYSRLMGDDEEATIQTLKTYREVITNLIEQHHGRVVDAPGDNLLAEFASAVDAVKAAVAIQHELKTRNAKLDVHRRMEFRIGLNVGDVIADEGRLYGEGVNMAARLEGLADPGGICLSEAVHMQVQNKLDLTFSYQGEQSVKNIVVPVRVYKVVLGAESGTPSINIEPPAELPLPDKPSVAVLPFTNMSNDLEQEYFSDGMTDDIITDLSKISGLFVIARNSTFTYKGQAVKVADVGRELGVRHVLEGSVRKAGNRVRINVQLIDAPSGGHVWAERYDRELEDIFALQDELTQKIVLALKVTLTPEERARFRRAPTTNFDAYDTFLRAEAAYWQATQEALERAQLLFEQAVALDPAYAAAYAWWGWTALTAWGFQGELATPFPAQVLSRVQRAIALDDKLATAHSCLGVVYVFQGQYEAALTAAERALTLDPNDAASQSRLGIILTYAGRVTEAIHVLKQAMRRDPRDQGYYCFHLGRAAYLAERVDEALTLLTRATSLLPNGVVIHLWLAMVYSETGRVAEAQAEVAEIRRLSPNYSLEFFRQRFPFKDPAVLERQVSALRQAGLK